MAQVHGNPEEMRKFAQALHRFSQQMQSEVNRIDGQARSVGDSWRDAEYQKFMQEWQQMISAMKRFASQAPGYAKMVNAKAQRLEDYLRG